MSTASVGLLFKAPLVRANLAGRKFVTRRNVSRTNSLVQLYYDEAPRQLSAADWNDLDWSQAVNQGDRWAVCQKHQSMSRVMVPAYVYPRWKAGMVMWQKETWFNNLPEERDPLHVYYRADPDKPDFDGETIERDGGGWRSSMLMPRWACRFERPIVSVTPTRLQEITDADARREGIATHCVYLGRCNSSRCPEHADPMGFGIPHVGPVADFKRLFESIHGDRVWDQNPCLWRVDYGTEAGGQG